jgi:uncharacterized lipoprotein YmbA
MWHQLESADIDKARQSVAERLTQTIRRQEEELTNLHAKHAEEIGHLEAKQTEIETLNTLIDRFATEFQGATVAEGEPALEEQNAGSPVAAETTEDTEVADDKLADLAPETSRTALTLPERVAVRYGSPNFGTVRKFGS